MDAAVIEKAPLTLNDQIDLIIPKLPDAIMRVAITIRTDYEGLEDEAKRILVNSIAFIYENELKRMVIDEVNVLDVFNEALETDGYIYLAEMLKSSAHERSSPMITAPVEP